MELQIESATSVLLHVHLAKQVNLLLYFRMVGKFISQFPRKVEKEDYDSNNCILRDISSR